MRIVGKKYLPSIVAALIFTGCNDGSTAPDGPSLSVDRPTSIDFRTRNRSMTDAELFAEIVKGDSVVMIGVKEPTAERGVEASGRIDVARKTLEDARAFISNMPGLKVVREFEDFPMVIARITPEALVKLRSDPRIDYVAPDWPYATFDGGTAEATACSYGPQQVGWHIAKIKADSAWAWTQGQWSGPTARRLTIFDDGLDLGAPLDSLHFELPVVQYGEYDAGSNPGWHGTRVVGIAAARNNDVGIVGVAPLARLAVFAVAQKNFAPVPDSIHPSAVATAIFDQASAASVISMSFSVKTHDPSTPYGWGAVEDMIDWAFGVYNTVFVASTGDSADRYTYTWPAHFTHVIGVGGLDHSDLPVYGDWALGNISIAAPATPDIPVLCQGGGGPAYNGYGTSWATPMVAAAVHMVRTIQTGWTAQQLVNRVLNTATDLSAHDPLHLRTGEGLLNVDSAVSVSYPPPTFSVQIAGSNPIRPNATCTWVASVTAGTWPISYQWFRDGVFVGADENYTGSMEGQMSFELKVWATDATQAMATNTMIIASGQSAPPCVMGP